MNITQLLHFQAIYKNRNMTHAANHLYITQQGLSRSIKSLENELETPLFIRTTNGVIPTPYAEAIIEPTSQILELYNHIEKKLSHMKQAGENTLTIDCNKMILDSFPHGTQHTIENVLFPNINFIYNETDESTAMEHLLTGEADLAHISAPADTQHFRIFPMKKFPIVAIIHPTNPLSKKKIITIKDISKQKLITFSPKYNIYHQFVRYCAEKSISPDFVFEVSDALHMYFLCKENEGIGICPAFYCEYLPKTDVCFVPFSEEELSWSITITTNSEKKLSPVIQSYIKTFETMSTK